MSEPTLDDLYILDDVDGDERQQSFVTLPRAEFDRIAREQGYVKVRHPEAGCLRVGVCVLSVAAIEEVLPDYEPEDAFDGGQE